MHTAPSPIHSTHDLPRGRGSRAKTVKTPSAAWSADPLKWLGGVLKLGTRRADDTRRMPKARDASPRTQGVGSGEALRRDHAALRDLLDRHAASRKTMRHLAYLEQTIARRGSRAFKEVPVPVLGKALAQLVILAQDDTGSEFAALHARLAMTIALRGEQTPPVGANTEAPRALDVSEASHSLFDEMERSWAGQVPSAN